jgi:hypothetical protein
MLARFPKSMLAILLLIASCATLADDGRSTDKQRQLIGVFYPRLTQPPSPFFPDRCPDSHPLLFQFEGESQSTLGPAHFTQSHCADMALTSFRRGKQAITTANGDVLYGVYQGQLLRTPTTTVDSLLIIDGVYQSTGGTGAFAKAHGKGISAGTVNTQTGESVVAVSGAI